MASRERIVIVGGGFAGATLAQALDKAFGEQVEVMVVSKDNHLVFTPMLPEVAARTISPLHVVVAGRETTRHTRWVAADVTGLDTEAGMVQYRLADGREHSVAFSHLVLACGQAANAHAIPGLAAHALPLKSVTDAIIVGNEVLARFEQAAAVTDTAARQQLLTVVVIGGGFSGVEVAGHLFDLVQNVRTFYPELGGIEPRLLLLQRGDRILPELQHASLSAYAARKLAQRGVEVRLNCSVAEITVEHVVLDDGERLPYGVLIGTVGNAPHPFVARSGLPLEQGRVRTGGDMRVDGHDRIWAIGDCARVPNAYDGTTSPPTAQFAIRQARQLAGNLRRLYDGRPPVSFRFRPQGLLASVGQRAGVAEIYGLRFSGFLAWFLWRGVYLAKTPTIARKIGVALDWWKDVLFRANTVRLDGGESGRVRRQHFAQGDTVYQSGDPVRGLYLIERGTATVERAGLGPVATLRAGDYFGMSTAPGRISAASALDVLVLDRATVDELVQRAPNSQLVRGGVVQDLWQTYIETVKRRPDVARVRVRDVMTPQCTASPADTLGSALAALDTAPALAVVTAAGTLAGYCGADEVVAALARGVPLDTRLGQVADTTVTPLHAEQPLLTGLTELLRSGRDVLPVTDGGGRVVGMLATLEAARALSGAPVVGSPSAARRPARDAVATTRSLASQEA
jgi:NADH dehydrogenase